MIRKIPTNIRPQLEYAHFYGIIPRPIKIYRKGYIRQTFQETKSRIQNETLNNKPGQVSSTSDKCIGINVTPNEIFKDCSCAPKALKFLRNTTKVSKLYSQTYNQYYQKRCQTFDQRSFNFAFDSNPLDKPGSPLTLTKSYLGNCINCVARQCSRVIYKPCNYKYATQGAVSSALRTYTLGVNTLETNKYLATFCSS